MNLLKGGADVFSYFKKFFLVILFSIENPP